MKEKWTKLGKSLICLLCHISIWGTTTKSVQS